VSLPPAEEFADSGDEFVKPWGYCARCKYIVEMQMPRWVKRKNGRPVRLGRCPMCGGKVWRVSKV